MSEINTVATPDNNPNANTPPAREPETPPTDPETTPPSTPEEPPAPNYEELAKTDKTLQALIDRERTKAAQTAREKEAQRQKLLADEQVSEKARFDAMNKDEQIAELNRKNKLLAEKYEREKQAESLRRTAEEAFAEKGIPTAFAGMIDFLTASAEDVKEAITMFSEYEYYEKGELDKRVTEAVSDRLKQKSPETHKPGSKSDYQAQYNKARAENNQQESLRIKREAYKQGIMVN